MASYVVGAFRNTFGDVSCRLHTAHDIFRQSDGSVYARTLRVAEEEGLVVWPMQTAEACCVAAFALIKCQAVFAQQCWSGSQLSPVQRTFADKYPATDFHFWAMYGTWSCCQHCGSYHFNDDYFKEKVVNGGGAALAQVRQVPTDPLEHQHGSVGILSRW